MTAKDNCASQVKKIEFKKVNFIASVCFVLRSLVYFLKYLFILIPLKNALLTLIFFQNANTNKIFYKITKIVRAL